MRADTGAVIKCHADEEQARKHLAALKINVQESGPLAALLEGFSADAGPVVLDGRMRPGDRVRVDVKGAESIVGRMVRPSDRKPATHVLVAPEGGGPHVEAPVKSVRHDTPEQQAAERARRETERETERQVSAPPPGERPAPPGASPAVQTERALRGMGKGSVRLQPEAQRQRERHGGKVLEGLLEAFNPSEPRGFHGRWLKMAGEIAGHESGSAERRQIFGSPEATVSRDVTANARQASMARMERMRGNAISAGARPAGETTAQEIARKSPGAQAELDQYKTVLAGARTVPGEPVDRHGGFKVGDVVRYRTPSVVNGKVEGYSPYQGGRKVVRLARNGNLTVRDPKSGTTHDVPHTNAKHDTLHPDFRGEQAQRAIKQDRALIQREKEARRGPVVSVPSGEAPKLNTAARAVQARIDAEHQLAAITYGQRTLDYVMGVKDERGVKIMPWSLPPGVTMRSRYGGERQGTRTDAGEWTAAQWSAALEAAAKLGHAVENPDIHDAANSLSDRRRTLAALAAAKKEAEKRLKDAKAAVKAHGSTKQLRLALAEALRRYPREMLAEMFGAGLVAGVLQEEARGAGIGVLLEGFAVTPAAPVRPAETPAQSRARAAGMVAQAQKGIAAFDALHPRGGHGRFSTKGGAKSSTSKRATRATPGGPRILTVGTKGTLVRSIQRQLHLPATGTFDAQTQAAIERYQRQHGLLVDGRVGAQTLASLRGNPNASRIKPGPIPYKAARVANPHKRRSRAKAPPAPVRLGTGVVV